MAGDRPTARSVAVVVALGVSLLGGVVVHRLIGATYARDLATICEAEQRSGLSPDRSMAEVTRWVRAHLSTPEGNEFYTSLGYEELAARAALLRDEAGASRITNCAMAESFERLTRDAEYRLDVQHLCSVVAFPDLGELDDDVRLERLEQWIHAEGRSPRTQRLADALRQAQPAELPNLLREAARSSDVLSCAVARVLEEGR